MNVLLVIAHYFRPEGDSRHSSTVAEARSARFDAVRQVIQSWRGHLGLAALLNVPKAGYDAVEGQEHALDILVLVRGQDHLLDQAFCEKHRVQLGNVAAEDPRQIPFAARGLFADARNAYDMFVYSEDDLRPADGCLLAKIAGFVETFGARRVALPNRYEWNPNGPALKTFIDGDLDRAIVDPYIDALPDEHFLRQRIPGREVVFRRAANPHSGFFALTMEQLDHWIRQPQFAEPDCSFIGPLESAATLGLLQTFPIYKTCGRDMGWLEIQHLDVRFSTFRSLPRGSGPDRPAAEPANA